MKDILVVSNGSPSDGSRLKCAEALAEKFGGWITAVAVAEAPPLPMMVGDGGYVPINDQDLDDADARAIEIRNSLATRFQGRPKPATLHALNGYADHIGRGLVTIARTQDVCVATLRGDAGNDNDDLQSALLDAILVDGNCAVLGLPPNAAADFTFENVAIAWNNSREAARAVSRALPLLEKAKSVTVILVDPELRGAGDKDSPLDELLVRLSHYGIFANVSRVAKREMLTSTALLAEAAKLNAQLLVMGAQGAGGLLQWFQGSVSRAALSASPIPLFMAH